MPKNKKTKVVSLVAYESGAESEGNEDHETVGSETEEEEEDEEEQEKYENLNKKEIGSDKISNESEDETIDQQKILKRTRETIDFTDSDDDNSRSNSRSSIEDFQNKKRAKNTDDDLDEEFKPQADDDIQFNLENGNLSNENDDVEKKIETDQVPINLEYTLEKGFPPGCAYIKLPSAPKAPCSQTLQNKIIQVVERMNKFNYSINDDIHRKKSFKNPSIYEKLIEVYGIDEFGSSFPTHVEDLKANGYIYYDELDQIQRAEWAKKEKEKKDRTKIEMVSGTKKPLK